MSMSLRLVALLTHPAEIEDVMKGTDFAESLPYVEMGRTAAAGASYGGYMIKWIAGQTRLVVFPDENHWVLKPANSVRWYDEVLGWLDRWTKK
jgi:dipeptidyl aminopeptidase/acylaminoacyl peptidase